MRVLLEHYKDATTVAETYGLQAKNWDDLGAVEDWSSPADPEAARADSEAMLAQLAERWYQVHSEAVRRECHPEDEHIFFALVSNIVIQVVRARRPLRCRAAFPLPCVFVEITRQPVTHVFPVTMPAGNQHCHANANQQTNGRDGHSPITKTVFRLAHDWLLLLR